MRCFRLLSLLVVAVLCSCYLHGQQSELLQNKIADLLAAYMENSEQEGSVDFNDLYEQFEHYQRRPINLNRATAADLKELYFLSDIQISNLIHHRNKYGDLTNIHELQAIPGFDIKTVLILKEIAKVNLSLNTTKNNLIAALRGANNTVYLKWKQILQEQQGFLKDDQGQSKFLGDPNHLYLRYKLNVGNEIKIGFIAEKDAGEPYYYKGKTYGADYFSFHAYAKDLTPHLRFLAIGDYAINLGQGLIMHNGFGAGKSSLTTSIRKGGYPIKAYSSVSEMNFLRGLAFTYKLGKRFEWTNFASTKKRNAGAPVEDLPFDAVFSLPLTGLNRTESEISRKHLFRTSLLGTSLKYKFKQGHIAGQFLYDHFDVTLVRGTNLYQRYFPTGNIFYNGSIDYGFNWRNMNIYGEIASNKNLALAQTHGVLIGLDKNLDLALNYRLYSPAYHAFTANAFGESPAARNESGLYIGLEFRPQKMWIINAYADIWKNPWLKFRVDAPGKGREAFLRIKYFKKRTWEIYTQFFYENKPRNIDTRINQPVDNVRKRFRIHGMYKVNKALSLRNRFELSWYNISNLAQYTGFLMYQDWVYKPIGSNYSFTARYSYFDIKDYDARIYAYENDILNEYYIPAYNGRGLRFYINNRMRITHNLSGELRFELTRLIQEYKDKKGRTTNNSFGSSNTKIEGPIRTQIKAQIKYRF